MKESEKEALKILRSHQSKLNILLNFIRSKTHLCDALPHNKEIVNSFGFEYGSDEAHILSALDEYFKLKTQLSERTA